MRGPEFLVVTDLDGTLLDAATYRWEPARSVLAELKRRGIPVVFCTSKTRAETLHHQAAIGLHDPFIVENGGAVCFPDQTLVLGTPYGEVVERFRALKRLAGGAICGFSELTDEGLARLTGLPLDQAALARRREYEEPFWFVRDEQIHLPAMIATAAEWGLRLTRGGRFWHLHADFDKGRAVRLLLARYPGARCVGLGDSALDLPMLQAVAVPVAVARPDGTHDPALLAGVPGLRTTRKPGPEGWAQAVAETVLEPSSPDTGSGC
ncbi:MAG: HAD-IIB family hydrolase [Thermoguttaceae bacterium]